MSRTNITFEMASRLSCTHLRILLNTICRKPGFNSLRTPLNHGAEQASNETLKQTQQRNWSNASQGGQSALKEHCAVLHYETASTMQQPRGEHRGTIKDCKIAGATTWQGQGNQIIHSPQYTTLAPTKTWAGSVYNTCYHENLSGNCIQHLLPRKLEREGYTTLATTITYEGSACSTLKQENYRGQCIEHLQTRKRMRAVHTAPANMNTWGQCGQHLQTWTLEGSAYSTCKHENLRGPWIQHLQTRKLRAVHRAPANTKTYVGSAYSSCKPDNLSERPLLKEQTSACSYDCTKGFINLSHQRFMKLNWVSCKWSTEKNGPP